MKVVINKTVLESIITNTNPYLDKKDLSSITSHILLCAKNGVLSIKATDHEIGLSYNIKNVTIEDEGFATANGTKLLSAIKGLNDDDVISVRLIKQKVDPMKVISNVAMKDLDLVLVQSLWIV